MFWDSSAVVPALVPGARSAEIASRLRSGPGLVLWWASPVECQSALWCDESPRGDTFVSLDERLREAARREGFAVLPA